MHLHAIRGCERTPRCTSLRPSFHFASFASEAVWGSSVVGRVQALHTRHACTHKPQPEHTVMKKKCTFAVFRRQQVTLCEYLLCAAETKVKPRSELRRRSVRNSMFPRQPIISHIWGFAPHFRVATLRTCTPTCTRACARACMHACMHARELVPMRMCIYAKPISRSSLDHDRSTNSDSASGHMSSTCCLASTFSGRVRISNFDNFRNRCMV
jgi:hypothetical protein